MNDTMQPLLLAALAVGFLVLMLVTWWKIFARAGMPGALGLLMAVPLVNIPLLLYLAFGKWPVLEQLRESEGR